jgi:hypothetical protein
MVWCGDYRRNACGWEAGIIYAGRAHAEPQRDRENREDLFRFCVLKSTYTSPKRVSKPSVHSKLSIALHQKLLFSGIPSAVAAAATSSRS